MGAYLSFGEFAKAKRLAQGVTLREFCRTHGYDVGNMSKLERGLQPPFKSPSVLAQYAEQLGLKKDSEDWQTFMDLAAISAGRIPDELLQREDVLAKLPFVFRTLSGKPLSPEKLRDLARVLKGA